MSSNVTVHPVTDSRGKRVGYASRRTDDVLIVHLNKPIDVTEGEEDVVLYVDPVPETDDVSISPLNER